LLKKTPETHPDFNNLTTALEKITILADQLDESIKKATNIREFAAVWQKIKNREVNVISQLFIFLLIRPVI